MMRTIGRSQKLIKCIVVCLTLCLLGGSVCIAPKCAAQSNTVRVAVINYPNYIQMNADGTVSGYAYEYLKEIKRYTSWNYEFQEMTFQEASKRLQEGSIDILVGNQYTEDRAKIFDYSKKDMGEGGSVLCVQDNDEQYCFNDFSSYDGIRIAGLAGSVRVKQTKEIFREYGVRAEFKEYKTDEESKQALEDGEVDAILMSSIRCESKYKILARLDSTPLYFCTNKKRPELKREIDKAMITIELYQPYYKSKLDEKYYGKVPIQLAYTQEEKKYIADNSVVNVAISEDLRPLEYYSDEDKQFHGLVVDFYRLIAEKSGLKFHFVARKDLSYTKKQMEQGEVQVLGSVADLPDMEEQWNVRMTDAYRDNSVSMLIRQEEEGKNSSEATVVLRKGYPYLRQVAEEAGYKKIVEADTFDDCVKMVGEKEADISLIPSNCVDSMVHRLSYDNLTSYLVADTNVQYSMGVSTRVNPLLISILNKSIASITKEQTTQLLVENLATSNQTTDWKTFATEHRNTIIMIGFVFVLLMMIFGFCLAYRSRRINRRLAVALCEADSANKAKSEFLSRMSHDMRTPLNGMLGLAELLKTSVEGESERNDLSQLELSGKYLLDLINDTLDVSRIEMGKLELHPTVCEGKAVFDSVCNLVKPTLEAKKMQVNLETSGLVYPMLYIDIGRVEQVMMNILGNAVKFTPEGGRIQCSMEHVSTENGVITDKVCIRDNGIGMSEEFLPHLFEPFAQEDGSNKNSKQGTGLGMIITKQLVELMGGTIQVESEKGKGTKVTFTLVMPMATKEQIDKWKETEQTDDKTGKLEGKRILLCEDQPLNAQIAMRLLENQGAIVEHAEDGQRGLEMFCESEKGYYDLILMDMRMPVMDGVEATKQIRLADREEAKTIPIIAMTANAFEEDIRTCLDAGMNAHIAKPIEIEKMFDTILRNIG